MVLPSVADASKESLPHLSSFVGARSGWLNQGLAHEIVGDELGDPRHDVVSEPFFLECFDPLVQQFAFSAEYDLVRSAVELLEREATGIFLMNVGEGIAKGLPTGLEFTGVLDYGLRRVSEGSQQPRVGIIELTLRTGRILFGREAIELVLQACCDGGCDGDRNDMCG